MEDRFVISAVIFDMDGLMFDTERIAQKAWQRAAGDLGFDYSEELFRSVIGRNYQDVRRITYQYLGANLPFAEIYRRKQAYFKNDILQNGLPLKAGLLTLLNYLDKVRLPKAVASSSPRQIIQQNIIAAGLSDDRFDFLMGGDDVKCGKPDPEIFLKVGKKIGLPPTECLVLEDSNAGIEAAYAAGMTPVMVPDVLEPSTQSLKLTFRILTSLHEVIPLIQANHIHFTYSYYA